MRLRRHGAGKCSLRPPPEAWHGGDFRIVRDVPASDSSPAATHTKRTILGPPTLQVIHAQSSGTRPVTRSLLGDVHGMAAPGTMPRTSSGAQRRRGPPRTQRSELLTFKVVSAKCNSTLSAGIGPMATQRGLSVPADLPAFFARKASDAGHTPDPYVGSHRRC